MVIGIMQVITVTLRVKKTCYKQNNIHLIPWLLTIAYIEVKQSVCARNVCKNISYYNVITCNLQSRQTVLSAFMAVAE